MGNLVKVASWPIGYDDWAISDSPCRTGLNILYINVRFVAPFYEGLLNATEKGSGENNVIT